MTDLTIVTQYIMTIATKTVTPTMYIGLLHQLTRQLQFLQQLQQQINLLQQYLQQQISLLQQYLQRSTRLTTIPTTSITHTTIITRRTTIIITPMTIT